MKGMLRFWLIVVVLALTALILGISSPLDDQGMSFTKVLGVPVVALNVEGNLENFAILTIGVGSGVMVLGGGVGVISIGFVGIGLLFGVGQLACGAIAFGQVGLGAIFFCGQAGLGLTGLAQGVSALERFTQEDKSGRAFFEALNEEVSECLTFFPR
jgi:hypothetical protein